MTSKGDKVRQSFKANNAYMSLAAHQSVEIAALAEGSVSKLHGDLLPLHRLQTYESPAFATSFMLANVLLFCLCSCTPFSRPECFILLGIGTCLSFLVALCFANWSESLFVSFERARERWEVCNYPEGEIIEMTMIYISEGFNPQDAKLVATTLARYPEFWIEHMLVHEIGLNTHTKVQSLSDLAKSLLFCSVLSFVTAWTASFSTLLGYTVCLATLISCIWLSSGDANRSKSRYNAMVCLGLWQTFVVVASVAVS